MARPRKSDQHLLSQLSLMHVLAYLEMQDDGLHLIPDLYRLLGKDLLKLLKLHGGKLVRLPTIEEVQAGFREIEMISAKIAADLQWVDVQRIYKLTDAELLALRNKYKRFCLGARELVQDMLHEKKKG